MEQQQLGIWGEDGGISQRLLLESVGASAIVGGGLGYLRGLRVAHLQGLGRLVLGLLVCSWVTTALGDDYMTTIPSVVSLSLVMAWHVMVCFYVLLLWFYNPNP